MVRSKKLEGPRHWPAALDKWVNQYGDIKSECLRNYNYLVPIKNIRNTLTLALGDHSSHPCPIYNGFHKQSSFLPLEEWSKYDGVLGNRNNVWASIDKCDVPPVKNWDPVIMEEAMVRTGQQVELSFSTGICPVPVFNGAASATFPFASFGFRNKADVLTCVGFFKWLTHPFDKPTIWRVSPKREFIEVELIKNGKIRTFIIPPLHLLWWQKVFYSNQDSNLIKYQPGGIRYGISFQRGGFHKLMEEFENFVNITYDVSGWDRSFPLMREVHSLRQKFLKGASSFKEYLDWMTENTIESNILLPNGDVIKWKNGNKSGSGLTTSDNSVGHLIIQNYILVLLEQRFGKFDYATAIYSEDTISGWPAHVASFLDKKFFDDVYALFGYKIRDFERFKSCEGIKFLGARCRTVHFNGIDFYCPAYDSGRIYAALTTLIEKHGYDDVLAKSYSLLHLAWDDAPLFQHIYEFVLYLLEDTSAQSVFAEKLRLSGLPSRDQIVFGFWLGCEYDGGFSSVDPIDTSFFTFVEEEGF